MPSEIRSHHVSNIARHTIKQHDKLLHLPAQVVDFGLRRKTQEFEHYVPTKHYILPEAATAGERGASRFSQLIGHIKRHKKRMTAEQFSLHKNHNELKSDG